MQTLLVTGASGFLGWNLCQVAAPEWKVYGTYLSRKISIPGITLLKVDLRDLQALKDLFHTVQPNAVIHLAAQANMNRCQDEPEASHLLNVAVACNVVELCADLGIPCVFTSTDQVFDGLNPPYRETDPPSPINRYGEQKATAEAAILNRYPRTAICRMPLMFGAAPPGTNSFLQPFIQTLKDERELKLFVDEIRTPISSTTAARGLLLALDKVQGLLHLGGKERISRYDFGRLMIDILNLPATGLRAAYQRDVKLSAPRPSDVSLDSSNAFALGFDPPSIRAELEQLKDMLEDW